MALSASTEGAAGLMYLEPIGIDVNVVLPLVWRVILEEDRVDGADRLTGGAIDTGLWVDVVLGLVISAVDAVHRADVNARCVFRSDARFSNYVGHRAFVAGSIILSTCEGGRQGTGPELLYG